MRKKSKQKNIGKEGKETWILMEISSGVMATGRLKTFPLFKDCFQYPERQKKTKRSSKRTDEKEKEALTIFRLLGVFISWGFGDGDASLFASAVAQPSKRELW